MNEQRFVLPVEFQRLLKRKSSRDPKSRFATKLHALLNWTQGDPFREEKVGAAWVDNFTFRIHKRTLTSVMNIKLNTLNVNLKSLGFQQLASYMEGWTYWMRPGFAQNSSYVDEAPHKRENSEQPVIEDEQNRKLLVLDHLKIGMATPSQIEDYKVDIVSIWEELFPQNPNQTWVPLESFLHAASARFRVSKQHYDNAYQVMSAIVTSEEQDKFTITDFSKFYCRYGPEETLMLKIGSLLSSSNQYGNWFLLKRPENVEGKSLYGYFNNDEYNCLTLCINGNPPLKIWNLINVSASDAYLKDDHGNHYKSWDECLAAHQTLTDVSGYISEIF